MRLSAILFFFTIPLLGYSQDNEVKKTSLSGEWRSFYSGTVNKDSLKDFHALATGLKINFDHTLSKEFSFHSTVYSSINTGIQDLTISDSYTGKPSRYEIGLFNVDNPSQKLIIIPGELNFKFQSNGHAITLGRFKLNTPFLNPQDGRMIPTLEEGVWYSYKPKEKAISFSSGLITRISPRSTGRFYGMGESIGKYPVGRTFEGKESKYANNTDSDFLLIQNVNYENTTRAIKVNFWNYYLDNIFNMYHIVPTVNFSNITFSAEWLHQNRIGSGGNADKQLRYYEPEGADILGIKSQFKIKKTILSLSFNHITNKGRFIFPREWGREFLFSFQKRERSEGSAGRNMIVGYLKKSWSINKDILRTDISLGYHFFKEGLNPVYNKYAMPNYGHLNLDIFYVSQSWQRFKPELLIAYKYVTSDIPENPSIIFNKADMWQVNFVVNYRF